MSEKPDTDSMRFSQILAGALAAVTAAVLGSTMGVAGTVAGAGFASVVTTVGGALYLRSIQRTRQGVRTVRDMVVARAGVTSVTLVEEERDTGDDTGTDTKDDGESADQPAGRRRLRWPVLIAASVLAFVTGMLVVTGVEWVRGGPLSGGEGTTVGGIVRTQPDGGPGRDDAPPATPESSMPNTGTPAVTVTQMPPTSENATPNESPAESGTPETTPPETATEGTPTGSAPAPPTGQPG